MPPPARLAVWGAKGSFCWTGYGTGRGQRIIKNIHLEISASDAIMNSQIHIPTVNGFRNALAYDYPSTCYTLAKDVKKRKIIFDSKCNVGGNNGPTNSAYVRIMARIKDASSTRDYTVCVARIYYDTGVKKTASFVTGETPGPYYISDSSGEWVDKTGIDIPLSELCP